MPDNNRIIIFDTTLRDGEQTPGVNLNLSEKVEIARQLELLGVDIIEAGFPAASQGDFEAVTAVAETVSCGVAALCRCNEADIARGWEAVKHAKKPRLHVFLATSEIHMTHKLHMTPDEVIQNVAESVALAKSLCADIEFSCEDASRSEPEFMYKVIETAIAAGATTINIPDTVGYAVPGEFSALISGIFENVPNIDGVVISVHCHDDLGLAVANTLSAVAAGARQVETTINGLGERAGNCSMEEVVMALSTREQAFGISHSIDTTKIYRASQRVAAITGVPVSPTKAIVGANAFAHESGIHQHGVLSNPMTYEIMTPQSVGKTESTLVLGKLSGRHAFTDRIESMGYNLTKDEINSAFVKFKELADRKKDITDDDLEAILALITDVPEHYRLASFQIQSGKLPLLPMASVTLIGPDGEATEAATGNGPIDAACNAISKIVREEGTLASYNLDAITGGTDAFGNATVRVLRDGELHMGRGVSPDIIEATILAYINAINRAIAKTKNAERVSR
ncbi:MAG: 2-isopropylmalate synthase [Oscillospiraceae bacterium]|nr:2-isopropylmalate synthase [Oscillospiraceae bacterium]